MYRRQKAHSSLSLPLSPSPKTHCGEALRRRQKRVSRLSGNTADASRALRAKARQRFKGAQRELSRSPCPFCRVFALGKAGKCPCCVFSRVGPIHGRASAEAVHAVFPETVVCSPRPLTQSTGDIYTVTHPPLALRGCPGFGRRVLETDSRVFAPKSCCSARGRNVFASLVMSGRLSSPWETGTRESESAAETFCLTLTRRLLPRSLERTRSNSSREGATATRF